MAEQAPEITLERFAAARSSGVTLDVREPVEYAYAPVPRIHPATRAVCLRVASFEAK